MIYDANGVETLKQSYKHLCPEGKLVIYGFHTMIPKTGIFNEKIILNFVFKCGKLTESLHLN